MNILTLGGVAVAVGRLVDDSIVVIENIFRRTQKSEFSKELIIDATREVARAITASTLTTVAVFLPLGLLQGSLQAFLLPFALTVTYSLLSSLFVALTVVPVMSAWLLRNTKLKEHKESKGLRNILTWSLIINCSLFWFPLSFLAALLPYTLSCPKVRLVVQQQANWQSVSPIHLKHRSQPLEKKQWN